MNYKHLSLIAMTLVLSACFSTSSPEPVAQTTEAESLVPDPASQVEPSQPALSLSPDQLLLQELQAQADLYQINKRALSALQREYMLEAIGRLQAQAFDQGLAKVAAAEALAPLNSAAYVVKADLLLGKQAINDAEEALIKALELNPYNPKAANRLAHLAREKGEFKQALALYTQAIESSPMHASSYRNRGVLNDLYLGDKSAALDDYQKYSVLLTHEHAETQDKAVQKQIKLVNIWRVDVERQLQALARAENEN